VFGRVSNAGHSGSHLHFFAILASKASIIVGAVTYPMNVSASKFDVWSKLSKDSSGIDKASVDATFDSDIGGAAI
jgi:hypothetical protein